MICEVILFFLSLPLYYIQPSVFQSLVRACKALFAILLIHMFSIFAPSKLVISFGDLDGNLSDADQFVVKDAVGRITRLQFPQTGLWIGNHQIYTDWVYMWYV